MLHGGLGNLISFYIKGGTHELLSPFQPGLLYNSMIPWKVATKLPCKINNQITGMYVFKGISRAHIVIPYSEMKVYGLIILNCTKTLWVNFWMSPRMETPETIWVTFSSVQHLLFRPYSDSDLSTFQLVSITFIVHI